MQTNFSDEQRLDPDIRLAEGILRKCVHCGFCLATCPTYVLDGDERDSPRGRIYLMKEMFESGVAAPEVQTHLDRCLTCGACETTCPSGVDYLRLVGLARHRLEKDMPRPLGQKLIRALLLNILPHHKRFAVAAALGRITRPFHFLLPRGLRAMASQLPAMQKPRELLKPESQVLTLETKLRVAMHLGCVQRSLRPQVNEATIRVLEKLGCEIVIIDGFKCCGALAEHLGEGAMAQKEAARNIKALMQEIEDKGLDAIVSNASGCGIALKDYGHLMRATDQAGAAQKVADLTVDISELLSRLDLGEARPANGTRVAWQAPCTLQHGQKINNSPRELLQNLGYEVVEPKEPHLCCGSAGTYSILDPERSQKLQDRKIETLEVLRADVIASANIGCMTGLTSGTSVPVKHFIELIDEVLS